MKISESSNFEVELPGGEVKTFDTVDAWLQIASEAAKVTTDDDKLRRIIDSPRIRRAAEERTGCHWLGVLGLRGCERDKRREAGGLGIGQIKDGLPLLDLLDDFNAGFVTLGWLPDAAAEL